MRSLGDVPLLPNGTVEATHWLDDTYVLAVVESSDCTSDTSVVVFGTTPAGGWSLLVKLGGGLPPPRASLRVFPHCA
jgi:hypothetical protein